MPIPLNADQCTSSGMVFLRTCVNPGVHQDYSFHPEEEE